MRGRQLADDGRLDVEAAGQVAVGQVLAAGEHRRRRVARRRRPAGGGRPPAGR